MKLVIDISEEEYSNAVNNLRLSQNYDGMVFRKLIKNGTPLKTGHWIDREEYDVDRWKCSECGRTEQYQENYCPNCGADMRGEQDNEDSNRP